MLTQRHKEKQVEWAKKIFELQLEEGFIMDETAFQLYRNTIQCWYNNVKPVRRMPKDRTKILAWC